MVLFKSKEEKFLEKQKQEAEDDYESSDETIGLDREFSKQNTSMIPEDQVSYRQYVNEPETEPQFKDIINKNIIFSNLSSGDREYLNYLAGTIQLTKDIFIVHKDIRVKDAKTGEEKIIRDVPVFDEDFMPILNYLKAEYYFALNSSRAIGDERAAKLDVMSIGVIKKTMEKKQNNNPLGYGGKNG